MEEDRTHGDDACGDGGSVGSEVPGMMPLAAAREALAADVPATDALSAQWACELCSGPLRLVKALLWCARVPEAVDMLQEHQDASFLHAGAFAETRIWMYLVDESEENKVAAFEALEASEAMVDALREVKQPKGLLGTLSFGMFGSRSSVSTTSADRAFLAFVITYQAFNALTRTLLDFKALSYVKGAYHLRRAWKLFDEADSMRKKHPEWATDWEALVDAISFGCGVFHVFVSLLPPTLSWIAESVGFHGDWVCGMQELRTCANGPSPAAVEASLVCLMVKFFLLDEAEDAQRSLSSLNDAHPNSTFLLSLHAFLSRRTGHLEVAVRQLHTARRYADHLPALQLSCDGFLADCHHHNLCPAAAVPLYEVYLKGTNKVTSRCLFAYRLGYSYWVSGDAAQRARIAPLYAQLIEWVRPSQNYDAYAGRKAQQFLDQGNQFTDFQVHFIQVRAMLETRQWQRALDDVLPALLTMTNLSVDDQAQLLWAQAVVLKGLKRYKEAHDLFEQVIRMDEQVIEERYVIPFSWAHMGEMLLNKGVESSALSLFAAAKACSGYDFAKLLSFHIRRCEAKLRVRKAEEGKVEDVVRVSTHMSINE